MAENTNLGMAVFIADITSRVGWGIAPRLEHMFLLAGYF